MTILKGISYYLLCICIFLISFILSSLITKNIFVAMSVLVIGNLICGVFLLKKVKNKLTKYHPIYNTLDNVASDKLSFIIFWLIKCPFLFIKLAIAMI